MWPDLVTLGSASNPITVHSYGLMVMLAFIASLGWVHARSGTVGLSQERVAVAVDDQEVAHAWVLWAAGRGRAAMSPLDAPDWLLDDVGMLSAIKFVEVSSGRTLFQAPGAEQFQYRYLDNTYVAVAKSDAYVQAPIERAVQRVREIPDDAR